MSTKYYSGYKRHLLFLTFILASLSVSAQDKKNLYSDVPFKKGTKLASLALGISIDNYYGQIKPHPMPILIYDQGFFDNVGIGNIGLGGIATCKFLRQKYPASKYVAHTNNFYFGVRGTYHFTFLTKQNNNFDPYAGIMLGIKVSNTEDTYYQYKSGTATSLAKGIFIGARYRLDDRFSAFSELGYNISFISIGINVAL